MSAFVMYVFSGLVSRGCLIKFFGLSIMGERIGIMLLGLFFPLVSEIVEIVCFCLRSLRTGRILRIHRFQGSSPGLLRLICVIRGRLAFIRCVLSGLIRQSLLNLCTHVGNIVRRIRSNAVISVRAPCCYSDTTWQRQRDAENESKDYGADRLHPTLTYCRARARWAPLIN